MKDDMVKRCLFKVLGGYAFVFFVSFFLAVGWKLKWAQIVLVIVGLPWDLIFIKLAETFWPSLKGPIVVFIIMFGSFFINSLLLYYLITRYKLPLLWDSMISNRLADDWFGSALAKMREQRAKRKAGEVSLVDKIKEFAIETKELAVSIITGKFCKNFKNPEFRKNFFKSFLLLIPIALLLIWPLIGSPDMTYIKVRGARKTVVELRDDVLRYKDVTGEYPATLSAMKQYGRQHPKSNISAKMSKEYISHSDRGVSNEYSSLNGKGGWYYDSATGDVKINLTKPVKEYRRFYFLSGKNEIPADW